MFLHRDYAGTIGVSIPLVMIGLLCAWMVGPVRRFYKQMAEGDFCLSCGRMIEGGTTESNCANCGRGIAESIEILKVNRESPRFKRNAEAGFRLLPLVRNTCCGAIRIDFRTAIRYFIAIGFWFVPLRILVGRIPNNGSIVWQLLLLALLVFLVPVAVFLFYRLGPTRRFHKRVADEDFCVYCEYSLRGHAQDGACPECGKDIAKSLRILDWHRNGKSKWMNVFI
ncbi:MAG TPA: hypothetical protein PKN33_19145 [Phycisphaerae bacterium]|nr:hypothetical protein [Phycisphaerae bacterium]